MLQKFWKVTIYVPIVEDAHNTSLDRLVALAPKQVERIVQAAQSVSPVGRVGNYDSIYEVDFGLEGYRPTKGAAPRYGSIGQHTVLGKAAVVTYVNRDCGEEILRQLVEAVRAVHPWEHPIIEFTECSLYVPDGGYEREGSRYRTVISPPVESARRATRRMRRLE
jgi:hypothetical protein